MLYYSGKGVAQNYIHAYMWFSAAYENGHFTGLTNMNPVQEQMTQAQIESAQKLVERCLNEGYFVCN